ncbi:hypothetical protein ACF1AB_24170 [Streptomyces sp. NPDC014846]|uniref:hypothetical protein n=1 Tax=Streptomyces sp. NPDC014846 TaxID=3364922 RepID=UPI003701C38A
MTTALLCAGWPRGIEVALDRLERDGRRPALLILPDTVAGDRERTEAAFEPFGLPVLLLPQAEIVAGRLSPEGRRAVRAAGVTALLVFRNDGGTVDRGAAVRFALSVPVRELLVMHGRGDVTRYGRTALPAALFRDREPGRGGVARARTAAHAWDGARSPGGRPACGAVRSRGRTASPPGRRLRRSRRARRPGRQSAGFLRVPGMAEPADLEPSDRRRMITLGGSALYGLGLPDNATTVPARLHRRLAGADDGPEVLSFAVPGGWSRGESAMLLYRLRHARPDCVVTLSGRNDFDTLFAMDLVNGPGAQVLNWTFSDYHHYLRIHAPHEIDDTHVPFARKPSVLRSLPHLDSAVFPRSGARLRGSQWLDNQALMATVCEQQGSHFVCALQPHSLLQPALGTEVTRNWVTSHYDFAFTGGDGQPGRAGLFDAYADSIASVYQAYRQGLAELSARFPTATFLDLSTVYADEDAPCFLDGVHLSPHGADVLADALRRPREGAGAADGRRPPRKRNRAVPDGGREPGHRVFRARAADPRPAAGRRPSSL